MTNLNSKIMVDGATIDEIEHFSKDIEIAGFTSNPTLMRASGVADYESFARDALEISAGKPFSFEVVADDFDLIYTQAKKISAWGPNVYVKIPVTDSNGYSSKSTIEKCIDEGVQVNVTAIFSREQLHEFAPVVEKSDSAFLSIFAGRIADTGVNPESLVGDAVDVTRHHRGTQVIWASTREVLNFYQASSVRCDVITASPALIKKYKIYKGKSLEEYSLETVRMFVEDSKAANYTV